MSAIVLTLRFLCELAALGALGWWGAHAGGVVLAIVVPLAAAVLWGAWVAPRARRRLRDPLRFAAESIVWAGAIAAVVALGHVALAVGFGVVALSTAVGTRRYEPQVSNGDGSSGGHHA